MTSKIDLLKIFAFDIDFRVHFHHETRSYESLYSYFIDPLAVIQEMERRVAVRSRMRPDLPAGYVAWITFLDLNGELDVHLGIAWPCHEVVGNTDGNIMDLHGVAPSVLFQFPGRAFRRILYGNADIIETVPDLIRQSPFLTLTQVFSYFQ